MPEKNGQQPDLDVTAQQRQEILNILQQHLPADSRVWAYGSRVTGKAKRIPDLDLAMELPQRGTSQYHLKFLRFLTHRPGSISSAQDFGL